MCRINQFKKNIVISIALIFAGASAVFAQNGLPLTVLQDDPYLESGNIEAEKERREKEAKEGVSADSEDENGVQYTNPDDPSTFYNAKNWEYGNIDYTKKVENQTTPGPNPEVNTTASDKGGENAGKSSTEQQKNAKREVDLAEEEPGMPLPTDALRSGKTANIPFKDVKFTFGAGWVPSVSLPILDNSVEYYFRNNRPFYFGAGAAELHFDWAFRRGYYSSVGLGLNGYWKYTDKKTEYYTLSIQEYYLSALFVVRFALGDYNVLNIHAGGGAVWYHDVVFDYSNGYSTSPLDWIFPQATGGIDFTIFFTKHFGAGLGSDFIWPFLIKEDGAIDPSVNFKLFASARF